MRSKKLNQINDIKIRLIFASTNEGGIGLNCDMPWGKSLKSDLARFKELTMGNTVVMGFKTYKSIGKPLAGRNNVVLSKNYDMYDIHDLTVRVLDQIMSPHNIIRKIFEESNGTVKNIDIIGGARIFAKFAPYAHEIVNTRVARVDGKKIECDVFLDQSIFKNDFIEVAGYAPEIEGEYETRLVYLENTNRQLPYTPVMQSIDAEVVADIVTMLRKYKELSQQVYDNAIKEEKYDIVSNAMRQGMDASRIQIEEMIEEINPYKGKIR